MAEITPAFDFLMDNEDSQRLYARVLDSCPAGGCDGPCYAISGINSGAWPTDFATIEAVPQAQRGPFVLHFYALHFWNGWLAQLNSQDLANRVFDGGVNSGEGNAVRWLQEALRATGAQGVAVDGVWGPITLAAANAAPQDALLDAFSQERVAFLRKYCADNPALASLIARAMK